MFKYIKAFFRGLYKILLAYPKICRYAKHKDKYPFEVRYAFLRKLVKILFKSFNVELDAKNIEKIDPNKTYLFVSNHQGVMDSLVFIYLCERPMSFVSKIEAKKYPIIGKACDMVDVIFFDRDNVRDAVKMIKSTKDYLSQERNMGIFPEGTRTRDENFKTGEYKAGALKPAYETKKDIVVLAIDGSYKIFSTKYKKDLKINAEVVDVLNYEDYSSKNTSELANEIKEKTDIVLAEFRKQ